MNGDQESSSATSVSCPLLESRAPELSANDCADVVALAKVMRARAMLCDLREACARNPVTSDGDAFVCLGPWRMCVRDGTIGCVSDFLRRMVEPKLETEARKGHAKKEDDGEMGWQVWAYHSLEAEQMALGESQADNVRAGLGGWVHDQEQQLDQLQYPGNDGRSPDLERGEEGPEQLSLEIAGLVPWRVDPHPNQGTPQDGTVSACSH